VTCDANQMKNIPCVVNLAAFVAGRGESLVKRY
jgi:hypothetical protein